MPDTIITPAATPPPLPLPLDEAVARLCEAGFAPDCPESLAHATQILAGLNANRALFLPALTAELAHRAKAQEQKHRYNGQTIELGSHATAGFILRANIWPAADDPLMQRRGAEVFQYGFAHDHNFDFLTIGYHGPGYRSEFFGYEYEAIVGYVGESVTLTPMASITLSEGTMLHYRAQQDVHRQLPPDALSISLNIVHVHPRQNWFDQYGFDVEAGQISQILSHSPLETLLTIASHIADDSARNVAEHMVRHHASAAVRLTAAKAMARWSRREGGDEADFWRDMAETVPDAKIRHYAAARLAADDARAL